MIRVQFPSPQFKIKKRGEKPYIFDTIRKTWLLLTPEEWVRQNIVAYLISTLLYPRDVIALEKGLVLNGLKKRFDVLVYNKDHQPWMIIECKAPDVRLDDSVLQQAMRYSVVIPARWIVITNGDVSYVWKKEGGLLTPSGSLPSWQDQ